MSSVRLCLGMLVAAHALLLVGSSCRSETGTTGGAAGYVPAGGHGGEGATGGTAVVGGGGGSDQGGNTGGDTSQGGTAAQGGGGAGQGGAGGSLSLRIVAGNLSSGNSSSYDPGHGIRIFQGLHPDIALVQEFNYGSNSADDLREFVDTAFGENYQFAREAGKQLPNGVVSRYPIAASGVWNDPQVSNREFAWARIDLPVGDDLWAVSVHLLTTSGSDRTAEANALIDYLADAVPSGSLVVLGGDFNTGSRGENAIDVLSGRFVTSGPYPVDNQGNDDTNANRNSPYDWVVASPSFDQREVPVVIGSHSFANGLVFDSRVYQPLSDVAPVLAGDSGATGMQHMAVVRQFVVE